MKPTKKKLAPLPKPNELWPFTRVDAEILERMHREHLKANKTKPTEATEERALL